MPLAGRSGEVVAVIDDTTSDFEHQRPWVYLVPRDPSSVSTILVRSRARRPAILSEVRRLVVAHAPPTAPVSVKWLDDSKAANSGYRNPRFQAIVLGAFGSLSLALSVVGVSAIVAVRVAARTREMGIRTAIGASPSALVRLILREVAIPIIAGVALGIGAMQVAHRGAQAYVPELAAPSAGALAGRYAAISPAARRAARVDSIITLRAE